MHHKHLLKCYFCSFVYFFFKDFYIYLLNFLCHFKDFRKYSYCYNAFKYLVSVNFNKRWQHTKFVKTEFHSFDFLKPLVKTETDELKVLQIEPFYYLHHQQTTLRCFCILRHLNQIAEIVFEIIFFF